MAEKDNLLVNGYRFGSVKDAKSAEEEIKKAIYFKDKMAGKTARNRLSIYDKILDHKLFQTPIGWEYLRYMQMELLKSGIPEEEIRPIPMYVTFVHDTEEGNGSVLAKQYIRPSHKKRGVNKFLISFGLNIILVILVVAMFVIALNSDNPNILNYKQVIVDEYASWEQELTEREKAIREKEKSLQMEALEELNGTTENTGG